MDRVNRRFLVASTLIAIPAALLMASMSIGTNPEVPFSSSHSSAVDGDVRNAFGTTDGADTGEIRQVVGKQPDKIQRRRPIFSRSGSSRSSSAEPQGLFESLFGGSDRDSSKKRASTRTRQTTSRQTNTAQADVNWDGIPFHDVNGNTPSRSKPAPLAMPIRSTTKTRVIRGGKETRKLTTPKIAKKPTQSLAVPKPPTDTTAAPALRKFSSSDSSRRSKPVAVAARRTAPSSVASIYGDTSKPSNYRNDEVADLVPRVRRRIIKAAPVKPEPTKIVDKKPAPTPATSEKIAAKPAEKAAETVAAKAVEKPVEKVTEKIAQKPVPAKAIASAVPQATLQSPKASIAKATPKPVVENKPAYSKPVDPKTTAIPPAPAYAASGGTGGLNGSDVNPPAMAALSLPTAPSMSQPTAAPTTRAAPVSHRSGPPSASFVPIRQPAGSAYQSAAVRPQFEDRTPIASQGNGDGFRAVGSGVAQEQPLFETAQARSRNFGLRSNQDPYGSRGTYQSPHMSTYGQPIRQAAPAERELTPTRPSQDVATYPMHSIPGHKSNSAEEKRVVKRSSTSPPKVDQFTDASGNRMRPKSAAVAKIPAAGAHIVTSELPGIRVITNGPSEVMIRQNNEYEIRVENRGSIDANGVLVRALIPDWADVHGKNATVGEIDSQGEKGSERLVWIIDHLPAGTSEQMFVRLMAARSGTYNLDVDWTLVPQRSVAQVKVHEPRLELAIEGPDQVIYGHSQTYKVRVLNPGDGIAPNVVFTLSPNSATPQTQRIGDIPAGKEAQFEVELTAQDLGDLKIQGLAIGDLDLRAEGNKTIRVSAAKLEAILAGPELKYQNTNAQYSLQLQNLGSATSEKVMASLQIPAGVKYLGGIDGATQTRDILKWEVTDLAPGASRDYQFQCSMNATGEHMFAFDCKGTAAGQASVEISTSVESIADLVLTINDPPAPAPIGSDVTYEIVVRNRGSREAKDVRAIAQFSHGIEPQRVEGQSGEVVTGQVLFDTIPRIAAGEEVRLRVIAQAEKAGHHRFRTEVRSGDTVLVAEEATHYMSPRSDRVSRRSSDAPLTR